MGFAMIYEISLCCFFVSLAIALEPRGCNVCFKEETHVIQRNYSLRENHKLIVRDNKPCSSLRHISHTYNWCKDFHLIEEEKKVVKFCCEGYVMDLSDLRCKPICKQGCNRGTCIEPDVCQCHHGWRGDVCNSTCPLDKWGPGCENDCYCENEAICNPVTGDCDCTKGWKGKNCSEPCSDGYHGTHCTEVCRCQNNAFCDPVTGRCNCTAGYYGPLCEEECANGTHGYQCLDDCKCQNDAICHHEDGSCECMAGWTGPICADRCQEGYYGLNCSNLCQCYNNGICDIVTGECECSAGFYGESCEIKCPSGTWGLDCSQECNCTNGECVAVDGSCNCFPGFNGTKCQDRACPSRKWGENCTNKCNCKQGIECHPATGECWCTAQEAYEDCSIPYEEHFEKQFMKEETMEGVGIWKIISVVCISVILLQLILAGAFYCRKRTLPIIYQDAALLPSYSELTKEDLH